MLTKTARVRKWNFNRTLCDERAKLHCGSQWHILGINTLLHMQFDPQSCILKIRSISSWHRSDTFASDRCLIDFDPKVVAISEPYGATMEFILHHNHNDNWEITMKHQWVSVFFGGLRRKLSLHYLRTGATSLLSRPVLLMCHSWQLPLGPYGEETGFHWVKRGSGNTPGQTNKTEKFDSRHIVNTRR